MRFNCGPTPAERYLRRVSYLSNWHLKFLWWPKRLGSNDCRWLETIWRKGTCCAVHDDPWWEWEYREVKEK